MSSPFEDSPEDLVALQTTVRELHAVIGVRFKDDLTYYVQRSDKMETDDGHFMITSDLSKPFHKEFKIGNQVGPFDYFYRPLPDYFNALRNAGWEVNKMKDWFIDIAEHEKLIAGGMRTDIERTGKVPMYTFIECIKP